MQNMVKYVPKGLRYCEQKNNISELNTLKFRNKNVKVKNIIKAKTSLRKELKSILVKNNRILNFQVKQAVLDFAKDFLQKDVIQEDILQKDILQEDNFQGDISQEDITLDSEEEDEVTLHVKNIFTCKCGWFLYNPSTLPCGHTTCKDCADKNMACVICGYKLRVTPCTSHFLEHILSVWFKVNYNHAKLKKQALDCYKSKEFFLALEKINLIKVKKDHHALILKSKINTKLGNYREALLDADAACKLNSSSGKYCYHRGICFSNLRELDNAIDAFQVCLEVEPLNEKLSTKVVAAIDNLLCTPDLDHFSNLECYEKLSLKNTECQSLLLNLNTCESNIECSRPLYDKDWTIFPDEKIEAKEKQTKNPRTFNFINGVPQHLIKEEDFECKICYDIFLKPITTPCGHVFCKNCLVQTLDCNACCPVCRLSLTDYQASSKTETFLIEQILEQFFNKLYNEKKKQYNERMDRLSRVGIDEDVEIPLFVCAIAFPYVPYRLHIYEPKYRLMVRECLESQSKKFGMCIPNNNGDISDIGTICEIMDYKALPDGRFVIETVATQRFLILNKQFINSMYYGKVTYFKDVVEDVDPAMLTTISSSVYEKLLSYFATLKQSEQECIINTLGPQPEYSSDFKLSPHGLPWVWWGLAMVPVNQTAKLLLLRSTSVIERMLSLQRFLKFLTKVTPQSLAVSSCSKV